MKLPLENDDDVKKYKKSIEEFSFFVRITLIIIVISKIADSTMTDWMKPIIGLIVATVLYLIGKKLGVYIQNIAERIKLNIVVLYVSYIILYFTLRILIE